MKCGLVAMAWWLQTAGAAMAAVESTIYDPDPRHLWNQLNQTLFERTAPDGKQFGLDELDILFWRTTDHLLAGPSREKTLAVLDEFISTKGEGLLHDPLKRAWLQRDLWALFDWSAKPFGTRTSPRLSRNSNAPGRADSARGTHYE